MKGGWHQALSQHVTPCWHSEKPLSSLCPVSCSLSPSLGPRNHAVISGMVFLPPFRCHSVWGLCLSLGPPGGTVRGGDGRPSIALLSK